MFSWKKDGNTPIAKIIDGKYNNRIIYLAVENLLKSGGADENMLKKLCKYCKKEFTRIDNIKTHITSGACKLGSAMKYIDKELERDFDDLQLSDGRFQILPHLDKRAVISISGPSGSGKTKFVNDWVGAVPKSKEIFLFSPIKDDESFKDKRIKQLPINDELIEDPIVLDQLADSVVIFDDIQAIKKPYKEIIEQLQNDILTTGRHFNIDIVNTSHLSTINGSNLRKDLLNESNAFVLFPYASSKNQTANLLKNYANYDTKSINKLLQLKTRWIYIYKNFPCYFVSETRIGTARDL
jgi:energy-coupling factor transporter ATP-binding protein EcfA2